MTPGGKTHELRGALMVCGTASDSGKSTVVTGLCRLLARRGVRVAPFKAQNMALNSAVTPCGHEIGRAQAAQALAAGIDPEAAMNPVLLKPTSDRASQVVVMGKPWATMGVVEYHEAKAELWDVVISQLDDLRRRFDVVLCEGAGSPAEINLWAHDIVNLRVAQAGRFPAIVVGDIERGGVFASLYGTVVLLPDDWRTLVRGFVINKFRGDAGLLGDGPAELERRTGVPTLGVVPWLDVPSIDAEDSLALAAGWGTGTLSGRDGNVLDVAIIRLPRISNFTDFDALALEPGVRLRLVSGAAALGRPDLAILPGTKTTMDDLDWLGATGLAQAITQLPATSTILGICGGYQMLGRVIDDGAAVESPNGRVVEGLGLLPTRTDFQPDKITRSVTGVALGRPIAGYFIHHGRSEPVDAWVLTSDGPDGATARHGAVRGTSLHGLFDSDAFREGFLAAVADRASKRWSPSGTSFAAIRVARFDALADALEEHLDLAALEGLIAEGAARAP